MKSEDFFVWCVSNNLDTNKDIAESFNVSTQTVRNWKKRETLPLWVSFACVAIENKHSSFEFSFSDFKSWQKQNNITTYEETGDAFGIKRQAVHQWFRRGRFPKWLSLACFGYNLKH